MEMLNVVATESLENIMSGERRIYGIRRDRATFGLREAHGPKEL